MASDAERASNIKAAWHCSDCRREGEAQIVALLAEVRLEEAKLWKKFYVDDVGVSDSESDRRLAELERAAGAGK